jgi:tight adherence protein C
MKIFLFIVLILLGLVVLLKTKSKTDKVKIYKKINEQDRSQEKKETKVEEVQQEKNISQFIQLPAIFHNIIYFKLLIVAIILAITAVLVATNIIIINKKTIFIIGFIIMGSILLFPKMIIRNFIAKRTESILKALPFFIDITAACVQSGMTIDSSLSYAAKKFQLINADLSCIMLKMTRQGEINGLEEAIKELHQCSTAIEIRMFCSTLQYSLSFGSTIYDQLTNLSQDIREMQLLVTEEKISKLSSKLTIPLFLFILIPFIVLVISPSVLEILTYVQKM